MTQSTFLTARLAVAVIAFFPVLPGVAQSRVSDIGGIPLRTVDTTTPHRPPRTEGSRIRVRTVARAKVNGYLGLKLQDLADAYLYLGDMESLTASVPTPAFFDAPFARIESGKGRPSTEALERFAQATRTRLRIAFERQLSR